ncbi:cyanate permease [Novosphingobium sp. PhB165]|uniref:MFS transporter n=1 Tax=Novosphingobium sp. PhB165 TaxID=2485105 RepID=UPI0010DDCC25|nr:MFS transporter [Novosphingobium sp. PhB165]TCM17051.1 cyanate permease [Novosphingobium sp. PhB165]
MSSGLSAPKSISRSALVMFAASLGFFFVTATTFTSLGYVLYTMVAELGWSKAAAGLSFSLLGMACGMASPLPPMLMKGIGTRLTVFAGCLVLAIGFLIASQIHHLELFFVATTLMGVGFSLVAPSPAVYLLATWFPRTSSRMIGFYFMTGAAGGIAGPLIVGTIVGLTGNWRLHWMVMAASALVLGVISLLCIRDAVKVESIDQVKGAGHESDGPAASPWTVKQALMTPSFIILALAMTVVQTVVTTTHSILVAHIAQLGQGAAPGAIAMSLLAFAGTGAKGVTGTLCERVDPRRIFIAGLAVQALAMALLWTASHVLVATVAAALFGMGWGMAWLSAHILLLRYFGAGIAGEMTAMATTVTTLAVFGPIGAGRIADVTGGYGPALLVLALMLAGATAMSMLFLRAPASGPRRAGEPELAEATELVPAE